MENSKRYLFISIALALFVFAVVFFVAVRTSGFSPAQVELEDCKSLQYNGVNKINILFFGQSNEVQEYVSSFFSISPFKEERNSFNIYYIDTFDPECREYAGGVSYLCNSRELYGKAASCPDVQHIAILKKEGRDVRSSSYLNTMFINTDHPKSVFWHEFGHNFAELDEEYLNNQRPDGPNCVSHCEDFPESTKCFEGCQTSSYKRSVDNGIMKTLTPTDRKNPFGDFNLVILRELIDKKTIAGAGITGNQVSETIRNCRDETFFVSEVDSVNGKIKTYELQGCQLENGYDGGLRYSIVDSEGTEIYTDNLYSNFHTDEFKENEDLGGETFSYSQVGELYVSSPGEISGVSQRIIDDDGTIVAEGEIYSAGGRPCLE